MQGQPLPPRDTSVPPARSAAEAMQGRETLAPSIHESPKVQMSIREQLAARAARAVKSEDVTIGESTVVRMRGMMLGERNRVMTEAYDAKGKPDYTVLYPLVLGMCASDPASGRPVWNPNDLNDRTEISGMVPADADALLNAALRLSGMDVGATPGKE